MKIPQYDQQIQPGVADVPSVPRLDLSGGLQGVKEIGNANIQLGEQFQKLAGALADHAKEQYKSQQEQVAAQAYTQYSRDTQDKLFSDEQVTTPEIAGGATKLEVGNKPSLTAPAKPVYQDVTRYKGEMLNELGNADGAIHRTDDWFFSNRNNYINQVQDSDVRAKLSSMIDNHYNTVRGTVIEHQVKQLRKNDQNIKSAQVDQITADSYGAQNPDALKTAIINVGHASDVLSASKQFDPGTSAIVNQKAKSDVVSNAVFGNLKTSGSVDSAYALLDSSKDSLSQENYDNIKEKVRKAGVQLQEQAVHADNVQKTQTRFNTINGFLQGKYNINTSSDLIRQLAISDPKAASALKDAVESPKGYTPISDVGDTYSKVVKDVFTASTSEQVSQFVVSALKEHANGNISKEQLSILYDAAIQRSKAFLPDGSMTPAQVGIDGGAKAILQWNKVHGDNDPSTLANYMQNVSKGMSNLGAYNVAIKTAAIKQYPDAATMTTTPNMVIGKNSPIRVIFPRRSTSAKP